MLRKFPEVKIHTKAPRKMPNNEPITNLAGIRDELYKLFNDAVVRHPTYRDHNDNYAGNPENTCIQNRIAIANLAQAIIDAERELREQNEKKPRVLLNKNPTPK